VPYNHKIKGKIVLKGQIECLSPVHIGSGRDENTDLDIIRDAEGNPFIPATSFVGILRHTLLEKVFNGKQDPYFKDFWGYTEDDEGRQSALFCSNLIPVNHSEIKVITRDGIQIDNKRGIVSEQGKFELELLERGARFSLNMEFACHEHNENYVKKTVCTIYDLLSNGQIFIGAKTNAGFGQVAPVESETSVYLFDFLRNKKDVYSWLRQNFSPENMISVTELAEPFQAKKQQFSITATLKLKNSIIVRSYDSQAELSDATQLTSLEEWVIPGTSLKGAIRARAERIINTLRVRNAEEVIRNLFGSIKDETKKKGKVRISEIYLNPGNFPAELQTRIKIDRFTGGVIEGALFDSMPVFAPAQAEGITVHIEIDNYKDNEAGLMLVVLKDLWNGDLAVGGEKNIGRGVFEGVTAEIKWDGKTIMIEKDIKKLSDEEKGILQGFVDSLVTENIDEKQV